MPRTLANVEGRVAVTVTWMCPGWLWKFDSGPGGIFDRHIDPGAVGVPVSRCQRLGDLASFGAGRERVAGLAGVGRQVAGARQRRRVGSLLLRPALDQVLPDVEDQGGNPEDADEPEGENDQDLTGLPFSGALGHVDAPSTSEVDDEGGVTAQGEWGNGDV